MTAKWQFILTDQKFRPIGELLNLTDRSISLNLNKLDSASFKMRLDNYLANDLINTMGYLKAYRNGVLRFFGPILSAEEVGDGESPAISVNAAGAGWILQRRFVGLSSTGRVFSTATDKAVIAQTLIDEANNSSEVFPILDPNTNLINLLPIPSETLIDTSTPVSSEASITWTSGVGTSIYDCITELASGADAFDWRILPVENFAHGAIIGEKIGAFVAQPLLGDQRPEAIFEWGAGRRNIKSYTRSVSRDTQANLIWHVPSAGIQAGAQVYSQEDLTSIDEYGRIDAVLQTDITDDVMVQALVSEHLRIRRWPRQILSFEPHIDPQGRGSLPVFGEEYDIGDFVRARIVTDSEVRLDGTVRIYGITFSIDSNGVERASTVLSAES